MKTYNANDIKTNTPTIFTNQYDSTEFKDSSRLIDYYRLKCRI